MAEPEAPWIEDSLARSETDAQYSTLKFNYNVFLCSSCLFIKQVSSEGKKPQQSLLSSNRITRAYLYILQHTQLAWAPLLFLAALKRHWAGDLCVIFQESDFQSLRREDKSNRAIDPISSTNASLPVRKDDLLHVVCHEEVIKSSALIPLHEGFLCPRKNTAKQSKLLMEILKDQSNTP